MTVYVPKPVLALVAALGAFLTYYTLRHEVPALVRYVGKFEAM